MGVCLTPLSRWILCWVPPGISSRFRHVGGHVELLPVILYAAESPDGSDDGSGHLLDTVYGECVLLLCV